MPGRPLADTVAIWPMNSLGTKIFDLSGNGNTGTEQVDSVWQPGKFGTCRYFSGNDYIATPDSPVFDVGMELTLSIWFNTTTNMSFVRIFNHDASDYKYTLYITSDSGVLQFYVRTASGIFSAGNVDEGDGFYADGIWHNLVGTYNGNFATNNLKVYLDGVLLDTRSATNGGAILAGDEGIQIGVTSTFFFTGLLDIPSIYNRALSASEIEELYQEPFCMFPEPIMPEFGIVA